MNSFSHFPGPDDGLQPRKLATAQNDIAYLTSTKQISGAVTIQELHIVIRHKPLVIKNESDIQISKPPVPREEMKKPAPAADPPQLAEEMDEEKVNEHLRYADHSEVRNYSNEPAAQSELPVVVDLAGTPYVPPASFSFSPVGDTVVTDVLLQNKLKVLLAIGEIQIAELQSKLNLKLKDLRLMEKENRMLIGQKQKELQPLLKKIRLDIQYKKKEVNHLQVQLQIRSGEVIVI